MKRLVMLAVVMLALVAATAVPAMADVKVSNGNHDFDNDDNVVFVNGFPNNGFFTFGPTQAIGNESETGNVDLSFGVSQTGNNSNQCVTPLQFGNTGSNQNAQGFTSFNSPVNDNGFFDDFGFFFPFDVFGTDVDLEGGTFEFTPVLNASCNQQVQQSSAASS